jgi:tRNA 2-thiouridine synthesizing protein A
MTEIRLDLRGLKCPLPALRTRKALATAPAGTVVVIQCTDPMATIDLPNLARETGDILESRTDAGSYQEFRIRRTGDGCD